MARILVVDDNEGILRATRDLLLEFGPHSVETVASFEEARTIFSETATPFDLVIVDFHLGENLPTGADLLRWIRDNGQTMPVVLVTGANYMRLSWQRQGFSAFIDKMRLVDDLKRTIISLLEEGMR